MRAPLLDHGLKDFQAVKIIRFEAAAVNGNCIRDHCSPRQFQGWSALGERDGTAGHKRNLELPRRVVHLLRPIPTIGEMLITEYWRNFPGATKHSNDLVEEPF